MKQFKPIMGSLDKLTEQERADYYIAVCDHLGLPQHLNLIEYLWMDDQSTQGRNLVLYCKKGGTDIIRENLGISTIDMQETFGDGFVTYRVKGANKSGRTEMAVGAAVTKGLSGKHFIDALHTAETRATRRMTLKFVGGGLLDESEVTTGAITTDISKASQPLSVIAQPTVQPNTEAGKDITKTDHVPGTTYVARPQAESIKSPEKRRRSRGVVLESPGQETIQKSASVDIPESQQATTLPTTVQPPSVVVEPEAASTTRVEPPATILQDMPSKEQEAEFRTRLFKLKNDILEPAGLIPAENVGGTAEQIKKFVKTGLFPEATSLKLNVPQWNRFFEFFDSYIKEHGAKDTVKMIQEKIGVKIKTTQ